MGRVKSRINLYSPVMGARGVQAGKPWWLLGIVLFIGLVVISFALQWAEGWQLARQIKASQADRDRLKGEQEQLANQIQLLTKGVDTQVTAASAELVDLVNRRMAWIELFQEMSVRVPDGVWLIRVDIAALELPKGRERTRVAEKKTIVLTGFARSHQNVSQLLSALEQSPKFKAVALKSADRRLEKTGDQVNFEIDGQLS